MVLFSCSHFWRPLCFRARGGDSLRKKERNEEVAGNRKVGSRKMTKKPKYEEMFSSMRQVAIISC